MSDSASEPVRGSAASGAGSDQTILAGEVPQAFHSARAWLVFLLPAVLGLAGDLWLKAWSFPDGVPAAAEAAQLVAGRNPAQAFPPTTIIPHVLGFTTIINHGAVFGIFQGYVAYFLVFSIVAMAMILWVFGTSRANQWVVHLALGMITAGALGNLYDRAVFKGVRDMLRFYVSWYPWIFNLADVLLCVGVPLLMLCWILGKDAGRGRGQP
ncbi:MAG TPA: signal peptidase II [Phycisphaerae bacterium]|nr:signal peptidase II [Phycisphaerae bacterium]